MIDIRKYVPRLSTCSLLAAGTTFLFFRIAFADFVPFKIDPHHCFAVTGAGSVLMITSGVFWCGASVLAMASVVLGIAEWKLLPTFKGLTALVIVFLNVVNLPSSDSMRIPDHFAVANLRTINVAEVTYLSAAEGRYGTLADLVRHGELDSRFEQSSIRDYAYEVVPRSDGYLATATPMAPRSAAQGCWEYFSTEDAVIRFSTDPQKAPPGLAGMPLD